MHSVDDGYGTYTLNGAEILEAFRTSGEVFLAVAAYQDNAVSVFHVAAGGHMTEVAALRDTSWTEFGGTAGLSVELFEGRILTFAGGLADNGIAALELGGGNALLVGTIADDLSFGFAGNDTITGSAGRTLLPEGPGRMF